ncbi:MAG: hypothetical protein A2156_01490 [Deltaproteobacteria bacterium RBG_16_48_10]|nr:MAG: hypothetical protein A2156_01490 [Deltaproteobacteria bacterium RBG_16_48_10]
MRIVRDSKLCHGCRTCELMCSFHHRRALSPEHSSIHITRDNASGEVYWHVDSTCDKCKGEEQPFCERYCLYEAVRRVAS